jgi:protein-L-isoaspartate(D-aspartate) O-methyltransferase
MPSSQEGLARLVERSGLRDPRIAEAFRAVDRADFVPTELAFEAYADSPIPIPQQQTTSQPSLIAQMIDQAAPTVEDRVLEVGTGYGFQTALLCRLAREVVSIDIHEELVEAARANLVRNGCTNVSVMVGDGWKGVPELAPFQAIVVSAAAESLPQALVDQLDEGGRLVIPIERGGSDEVTLYVKRNGVTEPVRLVTPARFVPLVRRGDPERP